MKTIQFSEAKTDFYAILKEVENGNEFAISYGNNKKSIAVILSYEKWKKNQKRQLGTLEGKMSVEFSENFAISDEELTDL
jgi:PHD/YefM family antitoxin component YafN of YafNO toxin-antitoxin module